MINSLNEYKNGLINIIYHDLSNENPFFLTWKSRELLKNQKDDYDIFMYIEDDILVKNKALEYWLEYNEKLIKENYNLGFLRIELKNDIEYLTDVCTKLEKKVTINNDLYCINYDNPYCAFWIYNKNEFNNFINSNIYNLNNYDSRIYGVREKSAIGLHGLDNNFYKGTIIPIINNKLTENCKIYHMANNYTLNNNTGQGFGSVNFNEVII